MMRKSEKRIFKQKVSFSSFVFCIFCVKNKKKDAQQFEQNWSTQSFYDDEEEEEENTTTTNNNNVRIRSKEEKEVEENKKRLCFELLLLLVLF